MKKIDCNPESILPATEGIKDFYWPDTPDQFQNIQKTAEEFLITRIQSKGIEGLYPLTEGELICLFGPIWMQLLSKLFMASAVDVKRSEDFSLGYSETLYPFWADYHNNRTLKDQPIISLLSQGPLKDLSWRWIPRTIRTLWRRDVIKRYPTFIFDPAKYMACTSNMQVSRDFCSEKKLKGFYLDPETFFSNVPAHEQEETKSETLLIDAIFQGFLACLDAHAVIRNNGRLWLRRQIATTIIYAQRYISQGLQHSLLPKNMLSNLGGIWNGLLRYAVKKSGGIVHVIDHGGGSALFTIPLNTMTNFSGTSVFYAFTSLSRDLLVKNFPEQLASVLGDTHVDVFPHSENENRNDNLPDKRSIQGKSILVIPLSPIFDKGLMGPYPGTVAAVDFNARLFSYLKNLGWDVTAKPHTAFMEFNSSLFPEKYGVQCKTRPFEEVFSQYDVILNCDFSSTILITCLHSQKPLILMNANPDYFDETAIRLLSGRAEIANFSYSKNGRIEFDGETLANMLEAAMLKTQNNDFIPLFQES